MTYRKGDKFIINYDRKGQFLATAVADFDTEKDTWCDVKNVEGNVIRCRIELCKFKPWGGN